MSTGAGTNPLIPANQQGATSVSPTNTAPTSGSSGSLSGSGNLGPVTTTNSGNTTSTSSNEELQEGGAVSSGNDSSGNSQVSVTSQGDVNVNQSSALADQLLAATAAGAITGEQATAADSIEAQQELAEQALTAAQDALAPPQNKLYLFLLGGALILGVSVVAVLWHRKGAPSAA